MNTIKNISSNVVMRSGLLVALFMGFAVQKTVAQCSNRTMACNNLVYVSLDTTCTAVITPDVILENPVNDSFYRVEVRDPSGNLILNNIIREDYGRQKLEVRVYCRASGIFCWGNIIVEDKVPPKLEVTPCDTMVSCFVFPFDLAPNALVRSVTFSDNGCFKPDSLGYQDFVNTEFPPCRDTIRIIDRVWAVQDQAGNRAEKTQKIYIKRARLRDIIFPRDTIIDCINEGDLSIAKLGEPQIRTCDHFEVTHVDVTVPVCGKSRKILRRWTVRDLCLPKDTIVNQVIKIEDLTAPSIDFSSFSIPADRVQANKTSCTATITNIPNPIIVDCNLANTTLQAFYQLADDNGRLFGRLFTAKVNSIFSEPNAPSRGQAIWDLLDVPIGQDFRVIFVANDGCGNISRDTSAVARINDPLSPSAVCEGTTTVSLNTDGVTQVMAESFDDHSYDNCGVVRKEVRRFNSNCPGQAADRNFGDRVHFCCSDIVNNPIKVVLRVYDAAGLFSDCVVDVYVQDKRPVSLVCPPTLELNCNFDTSQLQAELFKRIPMVTYICGMKSLDVRIPSFSISSCGEGQVTVTWTAMDNNGTMASCNQLVQFANQTQVTVTPPRTPINLTSCLNGIDPEDIVDSQPIVNGVDCENVIVTHSDTRLSGQGATCIVINRKWTVLDWCKFNGGNTASAVLDSFIQVINIRDLDSPVFSDIAQRIVANDVDQDCQENISITANATDLCALPEDISYSYVLDLNADRINPSPSVSGREFVQSLPIGVHTVTFTARDLCNNSATRVDTIRVIPRKPPTPLCKARVEAVLTDNGSARVLARDLNLKSVTGCGDSELGLRFSFDEQGLDTARIFTCQDVPNGVVGEIPVNLWVTDIFGNKDFCRVVITVSDRNAMICPDNVGNAAITGVVSDEEGMVVKDIEVKVTNTATGASFVTRTDQFGLYSAPSLKEYESYRIEPNFNGYGTAGISTLDIVLIQRHILGLRKLDSPYKLLAADVNGSNTVSSADLVGLRQILLGNQSYDEGHNWKFVNKDFIFDDPERPWSYDAMRQIDGLAGNKADQDFIGLKIGDVNGTAFVALSDLITRPRSTENWMIKPTQKSNVVEYTFMASSAESLVGLQLGFTISQDLEYVGFKNALIDLQQDQIAVKNNELRISWTTNGVIDVTDKELFTLVFRAKKKGLDLSNALQLGLNGLPNEVYNEYFDVKGISFEWSESLSTTYTFSLEQNEPNPFHADTNIKFTLPEAGEVELTIIDVKGTLIYRRSTYMGKGNQSIKLSATDIPSNGVYFYSLATRDKIATKRMIVLH